MLSSMSPSKLWSYARDTITWLSITSTSWQIKNEMLNLQVLLHLGHTEDYLTSKRLICVLSYSSLVSSSRILASWRHTRDFSTIDCSWNSSWLCSEWSCRRNAHIHKHKHTQSLPEEQYTSFLTSAFPPRLTWGLRNLPMSHAWIRNKLMFTFSPFVCGFNPSAVHVNIVHPVWIISPLSTINGQKTSLWFRLCNTAPVISQALGKASCKARLFHQNRFLMTDKRKKDMPQQNRPKGQHGT